MIVDSRATSLCINKKAFAAFSLGQFELNRVLNNTIFIYALKCPFVVFFLIKLAHAQLNVFFKYNSYPIFTID
jgi:hypothetical protein